MTHATSRYTPGSLQVLLVLAVLLAAGPLWAETASDSALLSFGEYFDAAVRLNPDLESQHQNVVSAKGGISVARIRPDPELNAGIDSQELTAANKHSSSMATVWELALPLETAGKRRKRIKAAYTNVAVASGGVEAFRRQLKTEAAQAFIEASRLREEFRRKQGSLRAYQELVKANEIRFKAGDIGQLELRQSQVESDRFQADVDVAGGAAQEAWAQLSVPLGKNIAEIFPGRELRSELSLSPLADDLTTLLAQTLNHDEDLKVAELSVQAARDSLVLAKADRSVDPALNLGFTNTPRVGARYDDAGNFTNSPADRSLTLGLTVSVPIPLSRRERGALVQAGAALKQAELAVVAAKTKAETAVHATYARYEAGLTTLQRYRNKILKEAEQVLEGVRRSYRAGEASLLELLDAQRTADDVYLGYLQALADFAAAKMQLQVLAGRPVDF